MEPPPSPLSSRPNLPRFLSHSTSSAWTRIPLPTRASFSASGLTRGIYYWWPEKLSSCPRRLVIHLCFLRMTHTPGVLRIDVNLSGIMKDSGISPCNHSFSSQGAACLRKLSYSLAKGSQSILRQISMPLPWGSFQTLFWCISLWQRS